MVLYGIKELALGILIGRISFYRFAYWIDGSAAHQQRAGSFEHCTDGNRAQGHADLLGGRDWGWLPDQRSQHRHRQAATKKLDLRASAGWMSANGPRRAASYHRQAFDQ